MVIRNDDEYEKAIDHAGVEEPWKSDPESWKFMDFFDKVEALNDVGLFASISIKKWDNTVGHFLSKNKETRPLTMAEFQKIYGSGRYELLLTKVGGGAVARDSDYYLGDPEPRAQIQQQPDTQYRTSFEDPYAPQPQPQMHAPQVPYPSQNPMGLYQTAQGFQPGMNLGPFFSRDYVNQLHQRGAPMYTEEQLMQRIAEVLRSAEEKAAQREQLAEVKALLDSLKRENEELREKPRRDLESDPSLVTTLITEFKDLAKTKMDSASVGAQTVQATVDPLAAYERVAAVVNSGGQKSSAAPEIVKAISDGISPIGAAAMNIAGELLKSSKRIEESNIKLNGEIKIRQMQLERDILYIKMGLTPDGRPLAGGQPQLPATPAQPDQVPAVPPAHPELVQDPQLNEVDEREEVKQQPLRTFLMAVINRAKADPTAEPGSIVDLALIDTFEFHKGFEGPLDSIADELEPWLESDLVDEAEQKALQLKLVKALPHSWRKTVNNQLSIPQAREAVITAIRSLQEVLNAPVTDDQAALERLSDVAGRAGYSY